MNAFELFFGANKSERKQVRSQGSVEAAYERLTIFPLDLASSKKDG